jgi:phosphoglycerate dehydrogenase-like enzyme
MKPRCLLVMDEQLRSLLFGPDDLARLDQLVQWAGVRIEPAALNGARTFDDVDVIVSSWGMPEMNGEFLARLPRLRALFHAAGTVKAIATDASRARGIRISNASQENARPTAEFAFAQIILSLKRVWPRVFMMREQRRYVQDDPLAVGCFGSTVGLISLGKIGRLVAQRLATLDVKVIAWDPHVSPEEVAPLGVQLCSLAEVFALADVVSCHTPLTPETTGLLGREHFAMMKPGATFINTARGALVRESELIAVLRERPDLFAALDVTEQEPLPADSPFYNLPNVALTPHIAGSIGPECRRLGRMIVDEVERYVTGQPLRGEVFQEQLKTLA